MGKLLGERAAVLRCRAVDSHFCQVSDGGESLELAFSVRGAAEESGAACVGAGQMFGADGARRGGAIFVDRAVLK